MMILIRLMRILRIMIFQQHLGIPIGEGYIRKLLVNMDCQKAAKR